MADTSSTETIAIITGTTAVLSSIITQLVIAYNIRKSDTRKQQHEIERLTLSNKSEKEKFVLNKKFEIAEEYYHFTRESLININRTIFILKNNDNVTIETANYFNIQLQLIKESTERLISNTAKYNLTEVYFNIQYTTSVMAESVSKVMDYSTLLLEMNGLILDNTGLIQNTLIEQRIAIFEEYMEFMHSRTKILENDLQIIKNELLNLSLVF